MAFVIKHGRLLLYTEEDGVTEVTVPEGVTQIEARAFAECRSLTSVTLPKSLNIIEDSAFLHCEALTSLTLPEGLTEIGERVFLWCSSLTGMYIPDGVTEIPQMAFSMCRSLKTVRIPEGVPAIESSAFYACASLNAVHIPDSVTCIGTGAFAECIRLETVHLPKHLERIGKGAFQGCEKLTHLRREGAFDVRCPGPGGFASAENITAAIIKAMQMTQDKDFGTNLMPSIKRPFILGMYRETRDPQAFAYIRQHLSDFAAMVTDEEDDSLLRALAEDGAFTPENIDGLLKLAAEKNRYENYLFLLHFKRDVLGFRDAADRFKL